MKIRNCRECENFDSMILDAVLNSGNEWIVVVDEEGVIQMMSDAYKEFIGDLKPEGKYVTEVIENTRLLEVLKTQIAEYGDIQIVKGIKMVANRVPIFKDGKIAGAVGKAVFKDINDFYALSTKLTKLEKEIQFYKNQLIKERETKITTDSIFGITNKILEIKDMAKRAARTDSNVLITGESGTGKELYANAIHNMSSRYSNAFVKINCAAIPSELLESELFGYEEGAFTGAIKKGKVGKFELADKGTIFLDEIGDMPMQMQAKLLRLIQDKEITRLGSNKSKKIDFRLISATNCNLAELVGKGTFREDLYYRLNVMSLVLPPLRERRDEIGPLSEEILKILSEKMGIYVAGLSDDAKLSLENYEFPGNIRELQNILERALNLLDDDCVIKAKHFPASLSSGLVNGNSDRKSSTLQDAVETVEKEMIFKTLAHNKNNRLKTAKDLGVSRASLYQKIEKYGF